MPSLTGSKCGQVNLDETLKKKKILHRIMEIKFNTVVKASSLIPIIFKCLKYSFGLNLKE